MYYEKTFNGTWWKRFYRGLYRVKQDNLCFYCQAEMLDPARRPEWQLPLSATLEHIYPRGHQLRGKTKSGWATACYACNQLRSLEWQRELSAARRVTAQLLLKEKCGSESSDASAGSQTGATNGSEAATPPGAQPPQIQPVETSKYTECFSLEPIRA